jgi:SAM-dependent methyltransferase
VRPDYFGPDVAPDYDDPNDPRWSGAWIDAETAFLAQLAGPAGRALELAIGTGRVALPLRRRGIDVHGIDLSDAMVNQLRAKPGGDAVPIVIGDMATTRADGLFDLVYLVFNTIGNLTEQDDQVACFGNAATHLQPGGVFVVETGVPGVRSLPPTESFRVFHHGDDHVGIDEYDPATQRMYSHHYLRQPDGSYRRRSLPFRYTWPAELDLMARLAGLRLRERWADWSRTPFTATSEAHVSVWEKSDSVRNPEGAAAHH